MRRQKCCLNPELREREGEWRLGGDGASELWEPALALVCENNFKNCILQAPKSRCDHRERDRQADRETKRETETERQTERKRETDREKETDRQTDRQTERQTETVRQRQRDRELENLSIQGQ